MGMKPVTKVQQELMTNDRKYLLKSYKLPSTKIHKLKRLSSINTVQQINQKVGFEFEKIILPKIEEAIYFTIARINVNNPQSLSIIEHTENREFQKIFLIKNSITNDDWIHFYVQYENGLVEGSYSFFYYSFEDNFKTHYSLGKIYWSRTTR